MEGQRRLSHAVRMIVVIGLVSVCASMAVAATFTLVAIPDIQNETQHHPEMLQAQVDWILNNRASENIVFVAQPASAADYDRYFVAANFADQNWYGGTTKGRNSYQVFRGDGRSYLVLNLAHDAPSSVLDWAQGVIDDHRGKPTIINTRDYLAYGNKRSAYGNKLWNRLVKNNPQVFMVLGGHNHEAHRQTSMNAYNKPVLEISVGSSEMNDGGYMRLYQFDEVNSVIHVKTLSPCNRKTFYLTDPLNQFDLSLDFQAQLDPVPEPTTVVLAVIAAAFLLAFEWRRRRAARWPAF